MKYVIQTPNQGDLGCIADEWEIHPSGALIFKTREDFFVNLVIAYAPGCWVTFWEDDTPSP